MYVYKYIHTVSVGNHFNLVAMYSLYYYVDALEFDFFLTHQLFISVSELCNAMMQKYPLITSYGIYHVINIISVSFNIRIQMLVASSSTIISVTCE